MGIGNINGNINLEFSSIEELRLLYSVSPKKVSRIHIRKFKFGYVIKMQLEINSSYL